MFSARLFQNIYRLVQIHYGDAMLPLWPVLLQCGAHCPFPPATKKRGIRRHVSCVFFLTGQRCFPIALQPYVLLCLCATRGLELQETSLIFCFNWILKSLNLKISPEFFKEREEGTEIRKPSMITDFFLNKESVVRTTCSKLTF